VRSPISLAGRPDLLLRAIRVRPIQVNKRRTRLIRAFVGMRAKMIVLGLQEIS
jgi:hypothetical protein